MPAGTASLLQAEWHVPAETLGIELFWLGFGLCRLQGLSTLFNGYGSVSRMRKGTVLKGWAYTRTRVNSTLCFLTTPLVGLSITPLPLVPLTGCGLVPDTPTPAAQFGLLSQHVPLVCFLNGNMALPHQTAQCSGIQNQGVLWLGSGKVA